MPEEIDRISYQFDVIRRYDHYIGTTNFKIGLLLSFVVAVLAAIVFRAVSLLSNRGELTNIALFTTCVCILSVLAAAIFLVRAVSPNIDSASYRSYIFFGDVANWDGQEEEYYSSFSDESKENLLKDICFQTYSVAKVTNEKFKLIGIATRIILFVVIPSFGVNFLILLFGC